jgi:hypothetical protein
MKRLLLAAVMTLITAVTFAQSKNLFWTMTVNVKMDKKLEYEKKLLAFVKTHYPQLKYRMYEVISGENTGSYVVVMGPTSYKELEVPSVSPKGEALMKADGQGLDALCNSTMVSYGTRVENISNLKTDRKLKYIVVTTTEITVGTWGKVSDFLVKIKEARTKSGLSGVDIDYFRPSNSGIGNVYTMARYVEKLEELDSPAENLAEAYDKLYGNNSWYIDYTEYFTYVKQSKTEIRVLRTDLSSL